MPLKDGGTTFASTRNLGAARVNLRVKTKRWTGLAASVSICQKFDGGFFYHGSGGFFVTMTFG